MDKRIHRVELPVPFPIATTNAYLVEDDPVTLIDTGLKTEASFEVLEKALRGLGYEIRGIQRILITHGHIDHYGGAQTIAAMSGAEVYIHPKDYKRIRTMERFGEDLLVVLGSNGVPKEALGEGLDYMKRVIESLADPLDQVRFIDDGIDIPFKDMALKPIWCPGHSPGLTCFYEGGEKVLVSGDHLLEEISPNPIIDLAGTGPGPRSTSLREYIDSIKKIRGLDVSLVLPGHGKPMQDFSGAIEKTLQHHERRLSAVLSVLGSGERTAYEISKALFPHTRSFEVFLGMFEVLGHLRILLDEGKIGHRFSGGMDYYGVA
jgi:glyoxylase-like metal-dependent hydrolase (beta-lactamase superfamily II)